MDGKVCGWESKEQQSAESIRTDYRIIRGGAMHDRDRYAAARGKIEGSRKAGQAKEDTSVGRRYGR